MTLKAINALVAKWQKILRLQDWTVTVTVKRASEMSLRGSLGSIDTVGPYRGALMEILDPIDRDEDGLTTEQIIVHELLHLQLWDCHIPSYMNGSTPCPESIAEERAVDVLSRAFVKLSQRKENKS